MRTLNFLRLGFIAALLGIFSNARAQVDAHEPGQISMGASQMYSLIDPYWKANTTKAATEWESLAGVSGTMFFNDDWAPGYVLLQDRRRTPEIQLRYNVYTNEIYFKQDSQVMVIDPALPVREFGFRVSDDRGGRSIVFRNGYPITGKYSVNTFYQVVVTGSLSLLRHYTKRVAQRNNMSTGPEKVINDTEDWYVYDSTSNQMILFKPTRNGIMEALPRYTERMRVVLKEKGLQLKGDPDWVILFDSLGAGIKSKDPARN